MEREKRPVWQILVWDWGYLLCFELAHKMAGFLLLLPLFRGMSARMLRTSELETVTKQTLRAMTESPAAAVVSFLWLLLFLWYFYFEMMTLTLACERAWRRESSSFLKLLGKAFLRSEGGYHKRIGRICFLPYPRTSRMNGWSRRGKQDGRDRRRGLCPLDVCSWQPLLGSISSRRRSFPSS